MLLLKLRFQCKTSIVMEHLYIAVLPQGPEYSPTGHIALCSTEKQDWPVQHCTNSQLLAPTSSFSLCSLSFSVFFPFR